MIQKYPLPEEADEVDYQRYYDHIITLKIDRPHPIKSPQVLKTEQRENQCLCFLKKGENIDEETLDKYLNAFPHMKHATPKCKEWKKLYPPLDPQTQSNLSWGTIAEQKICCGFFDKHTIHEFPKTIPRCPKCRVNHATVLFCRE